MRDAAEIVVEDERLRPAEIFEDTAIETEVIEAEEIQKLPATNAADVVRRLPGLRTQQRVQGEEAAVSIEGMPPEYTKILVNGQRITGALDGVTDLADIPIRNVERIEILRGNQGARYGTEAAGGVINVITRRAPEEGALLDLDGGAGTDGQVRAGGAAALRAGRAGLTLSGGHREIDGFDFPQGERFTAAQAGNEDSEFTERDAYGTLDVDVLEGLTAHSRLAWRREDDDYAQDEDGEEALLTGAPSTLHRTYETWASTTGFHWLAGEATNVTGDLTYFDGATDSEVGREFRQDEDQYKVDLAVDHVLETGPVAHVLLAALDWRRSGLALENGPLPAGVVLPPVFPSDDVDEFFTETGLVFESESSLLEWATLVLGLRVQQHSEFSDALLPQVALLLTPHDTLKLRLGWGRNQRNPSLRDLFQPPSLQQNGQYFLAGNALLEPESSESWRAGFEWSPVAMASFSITGFWNDFDDSIRSVLVGSIPTGTNAAVGGGPLPSAVALDFLELCGDPLVAFRLPGCSDLIGEGPGAVVTTPKLTPVFQKQNLDAVRTRGVEVRFQLRPHARVELELGYTYLDTEVRDSDRPELVELPNEPEHVVDARVYWTIPRLETSCALEATWRDDSVIETSGTGLLGFADPSTRSDDAFFLNVRLAQPVWRSVEVYLDALNLTDQRTVDSYAVRGRTFFVGVRASFHPSFRLAKATQP